MVYPINLLPSKRRKKKKKQRGRERFNKAKISSNVLPVKTSRDVATCPETLVTTRNSKKTRPRICPKPPKEAQPCQHLVFKLVRSTHFWEHRSMRSQQPQESAAVRLSPWPWPSRLYSWALCIAPFLQTSLPKSDFSTWEWLCQELKQPGLTVLPLQGPQRSLPFSHHHSQHLTRDWANFLVFSWVHTYSCELHEEACNGLTKVLIWLIN